MRTKHLKLALAFILASVVVLAMVHTGNSAQEAKQPAAMEKEGGETERQVTQDQVPAAALETLKKMAAGAAFTEFAEEVEHGHTFYEGSWKTADGRNMDVLVTPTGDLVEIEEQVDAAAVPAAVVKMAKDAAGADAKLTFEKKTMVLYEAKFRKDNRGHELLLTPDGRKAEAQADKGQAEEEEEEENEK